MKSQVLTDFIANITSIEKLQAEHELMTLSKSSTSKTWTLSIDESSNIKGSGLGLKSPLGDDLEQSIHCGFRVMTNKAEYEALFAGLDLAKSMGIKKYTGTK